MIYSGSSAIDYLATQLDKNDSEESSHWRMYHSKFKFHGNGFKGLQGFGGNPKPYRGLRFLLHKGFQHRIRLLGYKFPGFKNIDTLAAKITAKQNRAYDSDVLRQSLTLAFLKTKLPPETLSDLNATACVIGDGFSSMTSLLLASRSVGRVVLVNLTKTLIVDLWYLRLWMGNEAFESSVDLVTEQDSLERALTKPINSNNGCGRVLSIQANNHELIRSCPIDLGINIVSMQEMNTPVIKSYFEDLRSVSHKNGLAFYCCNREEKILPDGTATRFSEYPWHSDDNIVVDELCPWTQQYYTFVPPFYRPYDGLIRHRLVNFS